MQRHLASGFLFYKNFSILLPQPQTVAPNMTAALIILIVLTVLLFILLISTLNPIENIVKASQRPEQNAAAIEKRSGEVWQLLSAVKTAFGNFSGVFSTAQKNIQTGLDQSAHVAGIRTRAIQKKLKGVNSLTIEEAGRILPITMDEINDETDA